MKHRNNKNKSAIRMFFAGLSWAAASQVIAHPVAGGAGEESFFEPLPVVLTVSRMPRPQRETPAAVTVLDRELIAATGYRDLGRLLRLVPGMQVAQEGGNDQWVSYHGPGTAYPTQVQVLLDGRPVYAPFFGAVFAGGMPVAIEDIERIEVVRGTDSVSYGSQAFHGVVNIITRHTAEDTRHSASVLAGSHGIAGASARAVLHQGPLGVRMTLQHERDDGMGGLHDSRTLSRMNLRSDLQLGAFDALSLAAGIVATERERGYPRTDFNSNGEREANSRSHFGHLQWRHAPSAGEELRLSAYYARDRSVDEWRLDTAGLQPTLPFVRIPVNENNISERSAVELQHHFAVAPELRLGWGAEWRSDVFKAPFLHFNDPKQRERTRRLFGNAEWQPAAAWRVNLGLMAERADSDRMRMAPRAFLNWLPDEAQSWRVGFTRAYRQPTSFDRHADVRIFLPGTNLLLLQRHIGNPEIDPPRIDAFEAGFLGQFRPARTTLDVRLFHERIHDQIRRNTVFVAPTNPLQGLVQQLLPPSQWTNRDDVVKVEGIEYQIEAHPWGGGRLLFAHAVLRARSPDDAIRRSVAPYTASLTWLQRHGAWQSALTLLRMGPADIGTGFSPDFRYSVPAYTTLDASLAREFRVRGGPTLELRVSAINLLGKHQELAHYPLQRAVGDREPNRVEPQLAVKLSALF